MAWEGFVVDGHERWRACQKLGIDPPVSNIHFQDREEAAVWIVRNYITRNDLTRFGKVEVALRLKPFLERLTRAPDKGRKIRVLDEIGKIVGVSHDTVHKVQVLIEHGSKEALQQLRHGDTSISKAYSAIRRS